MIGSSIVLSLLVARTLADVHADPFKGNSISIDLEPYVNNKAFGSYPGEASFNAKNESYRLPDIDTTRYKSTETGLLYSFPGYTGPLTADNVICSGQTVPVAAASYFSASFLVAGDKQGASISANVTFSYTDNSTSVFELRTRNWYSTLTVDRGEIMFQGYYTPKRVNFNTSHIFERAAPLQPGKQLSSITLPSTTNATIGRLHIFAVTLWKGESSNASLQVQDVRPTQKWLEDGVQLVEVTLNNAGSEYIAGNGVKLSISGEGVETKTEGRLKRLCPGDQKVVKVGVAGTGNTTVSVIIDDGASQSTIKFGAVEFGFVDWTSELDVLAKHESPDWFDEAKYGIFIHWGPYAVTGWGNSTPYESYAEWFWWYSTHHPQADRSDFYNYRLRTYGQDWAYDDTFPDFTGDKFDPKFWVDLFADAGAKYFVITSKHHDGFALFDTGNSTNRSAIHYGPQRDIIAELFEAADTYQPEMRRGTYFSLPEWFNPDFKPYAFWSSDSPSSVSWEGVLAKNPYTGVEEPYTGHVPVQDFITDVMVPQMETLAYTYRTDIMWCDCGQANGTAEFAAAWWNQARSEGRQVTINSRCGLPAASDFDTPEYETFSSAQYRKWEASLGMDPYSYGYNRATRDEEYMNASTVVRTLVDMVAKNGNLLLDIGPRADGTIVEPEARNLREAGVWIRAHGEAIFNTTYWFVQTEITGGSEEVRFTQTDDAFYILFLDQPVVSLDGTVSVPAAVPILAGDQVSLLTVEGGEQLDWEVRGSGSESVLLISVSQELLQKETFSWVFKISYC